jgi:2-polyprenyl-6-methoxyphenol hydroxylase-like FAD-dependent oxidoreductase
VHVLIIGGGTGGMSLAHGLRQASVSVAVYERDRTRSDGLHGYRVGINPTGNRALQQCLPVANTSKEFSDCRSAVDTIRQNATERRMYWSDGRPPL